MDIHEKSVDMDMDMDVIFHIHYPRLDRLVKTINAGLPIDGVNGRGRRWPVRTAAYVARVEELICSQEDAPACSAPTRVLRKLSGKHLYSSIVVCCRRYKRLTICRSATYDFFPSCLRQSC